jgi:ATP-binding cassette subfamily B protein
MPREYTMGGRAGRLGGDGHGPPPPVRTLRERFGALRNLPPFLKLVWNTSRGLTAASVLSRIIRSLLPVATLYVGKLIIDEVVRLAQAGGGAGNLGDWVTSGRLGHLGLLLAVEFGLAVLSDVLGRIVSLVESLLGEQFTNATSVRLMEHAASLDLEDFEDSELQDRLDRARRITIVRRDCVHDLHRVWRHVHPNHISGCCNAPRVWYSGRSSTAGIRRDVYRQRRGTNQKRRKHPA